MPVTYRTALYLFVAFAALMMLVRLSRTGHPAWPRRSSLLLFLAGLACVLPLMTVDTIVLRTLQGPSILTPLFKAANILGEGKIVYPFLACLAYLAFTFGRGQWERAVSYALLTGILAGLLVQVLQTVFMRTRPYVPGTGPFDWFAFVPAAESGRFFKADFRGFPSGHAATAFGVFLGLARTVRPRTPRLLLLIPPALTALARVHFGRHWLSDTVAAAFLAAAVVVWIPPPEEQHP